MAKVEFIFDPFEVAGVEKPDISKAKRDQILRDVADYVLESVLSDVGDSRSPVTGKQFKKLDKDYAAEKKREGGTPVPNLLMQGDLLDSLLVKKKGDKLILTVGDSQQDKADGHNNHTGDSQLPRRPFIPDADESETFRPAIRQGIREIIDDVLEG